MTGFGQITHRGVAGKIKVEVRSLNNRFFDNTNKLPEKFYVFEDRIRALIQKKVKRGKVNLSVTYDEGTNKKVRITVDEKLARRYHNQLLKLKRLLKLKGDIAMEDILAYPGLINYRMENGEAKHAWPCLREGIGRALDKLIKDRLREGVVLSRDLGKRVRNIERVLTVINNRSSLNIEQYRHRLARRVKDLSHGKELDRTRLETEVAIFAKNCDIQEEITRIKGHARSFKQCLKTNGEVGKKLDFIAQELHREINTIGSKSSDFKISQGVIQIKSEIEKIREQVKNIE
jgi:uncharacterized protein (TIGR00255 family)